MHEAKQRVKEKLQAGTADVSSDTAAVDDDDDDALADTRLSGLEGDTQPSAPATARSMTGEILHCSFCNYCMYVIVECIYEPEVFSHFGGIVIS